MNDRDLLERPGPSMHELASDLFPICRSLTGDGVRETLRVLSEAVPEMEIYEVPSGTVVSDWTVPKEWNINSAWIADQNGYKIIDFAECNLHVMGYSVPINEVLSREELEKHLYSLPDQPDAIPYVTSYYSEDWGFCVSQKQREALGDGPFHVVIDSALTEGYLTYGEVLIPGNSEKEVLLSTYICHPSMANNELSGPVVAAALYQWIKKQTSSLFSYRILFLPETIGAITYLSRHVDTLRERVIAGWVLTCLGDERTFSYVPSRLGRSLADRVSKLVLDESGFAYSEYSFLDRGSDERQWCSPGVDLPVCSVMRSKYGTFPEYHTSLDNLSLVTPKGLATSFGLLRSCLELLNINEKWCANTIGEPQMGKRGLYSNTSMKGSSSSSRFLLDVLAYCDGEHDVIDICSRLGATSDAVNEAIYVLQKVDLISRVSDVGAINCR